MERCACGEGDVQVRGMSVERHGNVLKLRAVFDGMYGNEEMLQVEACQWIGV